MELSISKEENNLEITLKGRLDSNTSDEFDEALSREMDEKTDKLIIDVTDIDFISSKGLRILVKASKLLKDGKVIIRNPNNAVREVFRLSGLLKVFNIE